MVDDRTAIAGHGEGSNYGSTSLAGSAVSPVPAAGSPAVAAGSPVVTGSPAAGSPAAGSPVASGSGSPAHALVAGSPVVSDGIEASPPPPPAADVPSGIGELKEDMSVSIAKIHGDGDYTADEAIEYMGLGLYQKVWMCLYGFSSMAQASEVTLSSVILNTLACQWDLTLLEMAAIPSLVILAALPGDFIGGYMSDRIGRRRLIIIGQWIIAVSGVLSAFMPSYITYLLVRMCTGFGFGIVTPLVIVQVLEISAVEFRVYGVAINFLMWAIGDVYVDLEAYLILDDYGWRYVVLVAAIPSVIMAFLILFMDESPKYCLVSSRKEEAQVILNKMCRWNSQEPLPGTVSSIVELERGDPAEMFNPKYRQRSIAFCISFLTANAIYFASIYATPNLFSDDYCADTSVALTTSTTSCTFTTSDLFHTLEVSLAEMLAIPVFALCTNTFGRIKTAYILCGASSILLFILLWCFGTTVLIFELCALRAVTDSLILLLYVFAPESYPTYMRSVSFGIIMVCCNLGGSIATLIVYMVGVGYSYTLMFEIFLGFSLITCVCTIFYEGETMGHMMKDNRTMMSPSEQVPALTTPGDTLAGGGEESVELGSLGSEHFSDVEEQKEE